MATQQKPWFLRPSKNTNPEMWQRWLPLWHLAFFVLLAIATLLMILAEEYTAYSSVQWGLLHIGFIGWYSLSIRYEPNWWRNHQLLFAIYLLIGWAIWWFLKAGSSLYSIMLTGLFPHLFLYLKFRNAIVGAIGLNSLVLLHLALIFPDQLNTWFAIILITTAGAIILGYFIEDIIKQSHQRRVLIDDLRATRAQLADAERLAGIAQERQRLASDLHDTLVQSLISVVTHLEAAEKSSEHAEHHMQIAKQAARDSVHDAREVIWNLQAVGDTPADFENAIETICQQWRRRTNLSIDFMQAGTIMPLSDQAQHTIIRILQEALANISKYAQASEVFITLKFTADAVKLFITDDGTGFDVMLTSSGNGLHNMRQRANALNAEFSIDSKIDEGTTISVTFPKELIMIGNAHGN